MSDTYTIIKRNIKDDNDDIIDLKIIFSKKSETCINIKAFDTKGRYFYVEYDCIYTHKCEEFEYYKNTELNNNIYINEELEYYKNAELNNIIYINFEGQITIYLEGGGFIDNYGLDEQKDSSLHLESLNKKIIEAQFQLKKLEEQKINTELLFNIC